MEPELPGGVWKDTYSHHLLGLGRFLEKNKTSMQAENFVYLAGMIARWLDKDYKEDTETFIMEDPEEMDHVVRRHSPFIGQNAPVVTISRLNAEFLTITIAQKEKSVFRQFELKTPKKFFGIASTYSYQAGNKNLAEIFRFFSMKINPITEVLGSYLDSLDGKLPEHSPITEGLWDKFGKSLNSRNKRKEYNEKMGIEEEIVDRDSEVEVNKLIRGLFSGN
ncbi:MAG: hypothetical protein KDK36_04610 [Leptospiraceae bacterium]|nr:hypothetical protein [Leptospiraceae bacterium]